VNTGNIAKAVGGFGALLALCGGLLGGCKPSTPPTTAAAFDPLAQALASSGRIANREAVVPPQCYTRTDGVSNPCWVCHVEHNGRNFQNDIDLQKEYSFSDVALKNHWLNLFKDRSAQIAAISDAEALRHVRSDNYAPLRAALGDRRDYLGWRPDLDLAQGFDTAGFARDGSGWRAFRYKPFPGTFWPTNGSTDDVFIRLPPPFRRDAEGRASLAVYRVNLAILEAALTVGDPVRDADLVRVVEPVDERTAGFDLDGDGKLGLAKRIRRLPGHYAGGAAGIAVQRWLYPQGTEFLHSVRYLDPDAPGLIAARMKELRYAKKVLLLAPKDIKHAYREEAQAKSVGALPQFNGNPNTGLLNDFGWQLQAFIEDAEGRLRLQTHEEHLFCMGCHSAVGVSVDQTFAFPRKLPGAAGWAYQSVAGMPDAPQAGHDEPEYLTYFRRVNGGDEFRENREMLARWWPDGRLDEAAVRAAGADISALITPSRERALALNKAYMALVREQRFDLGRDAVLAPAQNVHAEISNGDTALEENEAVYTDGRLWLVWPDTPK
jgi:hypothetical protein